uniref:LITAF domain-containing protein n=1 Tax=Caenorhabditis japonica TaxID=281687 RepID=A0A8R1I8Q3_CAEJA
MSFPEHHYKVSPPPFVPLTQPTAIDVEQLQNVVLPGGQPQPIVIVVAAPKKAPSFASYETTCPQCEKFVHTLPKFVIGTLTWIVFVLVFLFFLPLSFVPFCLDSCKNVHHHCPRCNHLISIKKRIFD